MKILVAYDGSEPAKAAIEDLGRSGLPQDVEARVLCVADVYPHLPPEYYEPIDDETRRSAPVVAKARELATAAMLEASIEASRGAGVVCVMFPGWKVEPRVCGDVPYRAIVKHAEDWHADLVVIGSHGRSTAGRAVFGSVAQKVLAYSPCSVRIGRVRPLDLQSRTEPLRILIGMDNSAGAAAAVQVVAKRTWLRLTEVVIATALDLQTTTALAIAFDVNPRERQVITSSIAQAAHDLERAGLQVTSLVNEADPRHFLLTVADERAVDCIFVGARGLSRLERFLIGSVSSSVAARAECSVEVVREAGM